MAGLGDILKQAQKMKAEMDRIQAEAASRTVEGSAGGGMVTAVANGKGELLSVRIDPEAVRGEDLEMLQDLVTAAANDALRKARELLAQEVSRLAGGFGLPTGLLE
jgi:DNA-binding YbaB/EbfC family protein